MVSRLRHFFDAVLIILTLLLFFVLFSLTVRLPFFKHLLTMQFIQYIPVNYRGTLQASVLKSLTEPFKFSLTHFGNISAIRTRRLRERWSSPSLRKRSEHDANEIIFSSNSERGTYYITCSPFLKENWLSQSTIQGKRLLLLTSPFKI